MSGGIAYVLDEDGKFASRCNKEMVGLSRLEDPAEIALVKDLVQKHAALTESSRGRYILDSWDHMAQKFARVMPNDYRRVLEAQARMLEKGLTQAEAELAAFEENARDVARVSGN
jgi:glutamate synthase (ferredoxin)